MLLLPALAPFLPAPATAQEDALYWRDPASLVRVDVPDYPGALTSSTRGSLLAEPPAEGPWRYESPAEVDGLAGDFVASEALEALGARAWHEAGYDGSGVRIAVFDPQWFDPALYEELGDVDSHDCTGHPGCTAPIDPFHPPSAYTQGKHGIACAEVIRDLAPGAELHAVLVTSLTSLENAVDWAVREQVDLVSMSLSFYNESFYDGTGPVSELVEELAAGDVLLVTSAGNSAYEHWSGDFEDADGDGWHDFPDGALYLYLPEGDSPVYVSWDQYGHCGDTDLDAYVYDGDEVVGRGEDRQEAGARNCQPEERFTVHAPEEGWYALQLRRAGGDPHLRFSVWVRGGYVWHYRAEGSITDPAVHPLALAVGAVRAEGYLGNPAERFSSRGPTEAGEPKPELVGPDGLSTAAYGAGGFYGTSASTPAVAAALALVMQRWPELDPYEAARLLQDAALDGPPSWEGPDEALGAGYARLPSLHGAGEGCRGGRLIDFIWFPPLLLWRKRPRPR